MEKFFMAATTYDTSAVSNLANSAYNTFESIVNIILPIFIAVILVLGLFYGIQLAVKYARAEEEEDKKKAKNSLINVIVGCLIAVVAIAVILVILSSGYIKSLFGGGIQTNLGDYDQTQTVSQYTSWSNSISGDNNELEGYITAYASSGILYDVSTQMSNLNSALKTLMSKLDALNLVDVDGATASDVENAWKAVTDGTMTGNTPVGTVIDNAGTLESAIKNLAGYDSDNDALAAIDLCSSVTSIAKEIAEKYNSLYSN